MFKKIKLLNAKPVGLQHYKDNSKDVIWFYIHGLMIDYTINEKPHRLLMEKLETVVLLSIGNLLRKMIHGLLI